MLTGVGTWVGKPAYLTADPLTIQEGQQEIAQAITEHQIKARGPRHPLVNPSTPQPFRFDLQGNSPQRDIPRDVNSDLKLLPQQLPRGWNHNRCRRDQGLLPPQSPLPSSDHGLKATGAWCWLPWQCHHYQTGQKAPSIPREVDNVGKPEHTWKLIYLSLKMRLERMLWLIKVGGGIWWYAIVQDAEIIRSSCIPFGPCKATPES